MSNKIKLSILGGLAALLMLTGIGSAKAFAKGIAPDVLKPDEPHKETTYYVYHAGMITPNNTIEPMSHNPSKFKQLLGNESKFKTIYFTEELTWVMDNFGGSEENKQVIFHEKARANVLYGDEKLNAEAMEKKLTESLPDDLKANLISKFPKFDHVRIYRLVNEWDNIHVDLELVNAENEPIIPLPTPDPNPSPNPSPDPGPTIIEPITDPEKNPDNNPGNNNPTVEIADDSTPLSFPIEDESAILEDEAPVEEVEEDEVPLSEEVEEISIEEDDTPLTDIPKTGDNDSLLYSFYAVAVSILSFFGFLVWKRVRK